MFSNVKAALLTGTGSADLPWCSGTFIDKAASTATWTVFTPDVSNGTTSMVSGNTFKAPSAGLYVLFTGGGNLALTTASAQFYVHSTISKNLTTPAIGSTMISNAELFHYNSTGGSYIQGNTAMVYLDTNEYLIWSLFCDKAISTTLYNGATHKFTFAKIR